MADAQTPPQLSAHDQAMVDKVDAASAAAEQQAGIKPPAPSATAPAKPERPADVPEKFWDAEKGVVNTEALLKSYTELEKGKAPAAQQDPAKAPADGEKPPEGEPSKVNPQEAQDAAAKEFSEKGELSEETYKSLEAAGFPKDMVDSYIAGQMALAAQRDAQGYELAGGQEQYSAMAKWAGANLTAPELQAFNDAIAGTPAQMKQAILGLKAQYEGAAGRDPKLVQGGGGNGGVNGAFASRAEVTAAMRDSRYRSDPAYRAEVERRIGLMDNF
jgi:hypothetical protein